MKQYRGAVLDNPDGFFLAVLQRIKISDFASDIKKAAWDVMKSDSDKWPQSMTGIISITYAPGGKLNITIVESETAAAAKAKTNNNQMNEAKADSGGKAAGGNTNGEAAGDGFIFEFMEDGAGLDRGQFLDRFRETYVPRECAHQSTSLKFFIYEGKYCSVYEICDQCGKLLNYIGFCNCFSVSVQSWFLSCMDHHEF